MSPSLAPGDLLGRVERDAARRPSQPQRAALRGRHHAAQGGADAEGRRLAPPRPSCGATAPINAATARRWSSSTAQSRSYVLDLYPGNSAVEFLLREGLDVFLLDWGVPDEADAGNTLEYYVDDGISAAVAAACEVAGTDDVNLLGYCFGGVLSLLSAARHPELPIRNLAAMATPVDFSQMETITALIRDGRLEPDDVVEPTGNVLPDVIENGFKLLKPTAEVTQYATLWENLWNDEFMEGYQAMGQWARDHIPFPGAAFAQTVEGRAPQRARRGHVRTRRRAGRPEEHHAAGAEHHGRARPHRPARRRRAAARPRRRGGEGGAAAGRRDTPGSSRDARPQR